MCPRWGSDRLADDAVVPVPRLGIDGLTRPNRGGAETTEVGSLVATASPARMNDRIAVGAV